MSEPRRYYIDDCRDDAVARSSVSGGQMTESEISALKEKAQKATPKERWHEIDIVTNRRVDAEYIAAAHPQAILALIEKVEKMREALEFYKGNFDGKEGSYWLDGYKFIQEDKFGDTKHFDNGDRALEILSCTRVFKT